VREASIIFSVLEADAPWSNGLGKVRVSGFLNISLYRVKRQSNPITGLDRPWGFMDVVAPRFQDKRHMKVVRWSALRTAETFRVDNIVTLSCASRFSVLRHWNKFYVLRTVHFGMKLCNDQRNAQCFNLFIYLLLPYMFRAFYYPIFRGRCTTSAVVQVSWVWCQRPWRWHHTPETWWANRQPETRKAEVNR
jgi:hypothetical protein